MQQVNILLLGADGVGKSTYLHRHQTGEFYASSVPQILVTDIEFNTNKGMVRCSVTEANGIDSKALAKQDVAFIMFSLDNIESYSIASSLATQLRSQSHIPIVLLGNKIDLKEIKIKPRHILIHRRISNSTFYLISAKSNYNFDKPFLIAIRSQLGDDTEFVAMDIIYPHPLPLIYPLPKNINIYPLPDY